MNTSKLTTSLMLAAVMALPVDVRAGENSQADRRSNDDSWIERNAEPLHEDRVNGHKYMNDLNTLPPTAAGPKATHSDGAEMRPMPMGETAHQYKLRVFGTND